jgi:branched-subunit amino acid aminotransferase/4-amino-4-deoxychorismate lyase
MNKKMTCINGSFFPSAEARIPVTDRGFRFGDGVFETIAVVGGVAYQWEFHRERCLQGLRALRITPPTFDWPTMLAQCLTQNHASDGFLRIAISRGCGSQGYMPDAGIAATWVIEHLDAMPPTLGPITLYRSTIERPSLAALPVNHKLAQGVGSTLALLEARDHGCHEALMLNANGHVCEAASANIFWIRGHQLYTPALSTGCVNGSTRAAIMRLAPCIEATATLEEFCTAEAVFLSNVRLGVAAMSSLLPNDVHFSTTHPQLLEIASRLKEDRAAYTSQQRSAWAAA